MARRYIFGSKRRRRCRTYYSGCSSLTQTISVFFAVRKYLCYTRSGGQGVDVAIIHMGTLSNLLSTISGFTPFLGML